MSAMPEQHNTQDDRLPSLQPAQSALRPVPDWPLDFRPPSTTAADSKTGIPAAPVPTRIDSARTGPRYASALPDWYSTVGPCVFCPTQLDTNPGLKAGTREYQIALDTKHCHGIKAFCAQGKHSDPLAINGVDLRGIWDRPAVQGSSGDDAFAAGMTGNNQPSTFPLNPDATHSTPSQPAYKSFTFNPESPEFIPDRYLTLEYLNQVVEEARQARRKAPQGTQQWRNAEVRWIATLKKRSLFMIALRRAEEE
ncbi:hypothetical protein FN846DRAFT_910833 [Sphaerosporella brunnea]|uniref:Uncharacterized protein n=1 Tax=Sphaerosporella brunnea TaxID=1250544 RepID=A0A5J5EKU7_9PEZI|nr:hypothetical protein FN846DRAFT_910833 [Sphaerosporella brunnea]